MTPARAHAEKASFIWTVKEILRDHNKQHQYSKVNLPNVARLRRQVPALQWFADHPLCHYREQADPAESNASNASEMRAQRKSRRSFS